MTAEKDPTREMEPVDRLENNHTAHKNDVEATTAVSQSPSLPDPYIVDWDGPNDPHNPFNWTTFKKARQLVGMAFNTFLT